MVDVTLNGDITSTGDSDITDRGFVWDTSSYGDPGNTPPSSASYNDDWTESGTFGTGTYSHTETLNDGTTYYYRACAKNEVGWVYGDEVSFTTPSGAGSIIVTSSGIVLTSDAKRKTTS